jgi:hypothetical protein
MLIFENNIDTDSSFNTMMSAGEGKVFIQAYAESGIVANTSMLAQWGGSGYAATLISACTSECGYLAYPKDGKALASGCVGWVQIRGKIEDVQSGWATGYTGSVGHAVVMGATATAAGLYATSAANVGNGVVGQVGVLLEAASGSLTTTVYLTGVYATVYDMG